MSVAKISKPEQIEGKLSAWLDTTRHSQENIFFVVWLNRPLNIIRVALFLQFMHCLYLLSTKMQDPSVRKGAVRAVKSGRVTGGS